MKSSRILAAAIAGSIALTAAAALVPPPARAELAKGATAPMFATQAALAGKAFRFDLASALKRGPVVLYFYPKAFTEGCTLEARAFAEASGDFRKAGATVIGMSNDGLATLQKFSTSECRGKFAVGSATPAIVKGYDVDLKKLGVSTGLTTRTSYVIAPGSRIAFAHEDMDYKDHVRLTLAAVRDLKARR